MHITAIILTHLGIIIKIEKLLTLEVQHWDTAILKYKNVYRK